MIRALQSVLDIFYPRVCIACESNHHGDQLPLCIGCLSEVALTGLEAQKINLITDRLQGRIAIEAATGLLFFTKDSIAQTLTHRAKYSNDGQLAEVLGHWMGKILKKSPLYQNVEIVVPVPLYYKKLRLRGYNQSEAFARGIAQELGITVAPNALKRLQTSVSQTKKSKLERIENVHSSFALDNTNGLKNKHILLVDDVLTTGATLEACGDLLNTIEGVKLYLAVISVALDV